MNKLNIYNFIIIFLILFIITAVGCNNNNTNGDNILYIDNEKDIFKILQLTDLHLTNDLDVAYGNAYPNETYEFVRYVVEESNPDLIVLTGDIFYHTNAKAEELRLLMDSLKIPFTFVWGNHDATTLIEKNNISNELLKSDYCLWKNDYQNKDLKRTGDHAIQLRTNDTDKLLYCFYMLDSGTYNGKIYESVYEDQLNQYKNVMDKLNEIYKKQENNKYDIIPNLVFQHIPVEEYRTLYSEDKLILGRKIENPCNGEENTGQYEFMKKYNMKAMFVGHDHMNNYAFKTEDGIILAYGGQAGYSNTYDEYYPDVTRLWNALEITIDSNREISLKLIEKDK